MKELTLQELKNESLKILKDVHDFCIKNDIKYSIAYGTLIGAVRHKGFIPWDEDIDIVMTRENYNKFIHSYKSENYSLINKEINPSCWILFSRVCDMTNTISRTSTAWLGDGTETGVWIDIFPIDNAPDDPKEYETIFMMMNHLYLYGNKIRKVHSPMLPNTPLSMRLKSWFKRKTNPNLRDKHCPDEFLNFQTEIIKLINNPNSEHVSQLCVVDRCNGYYLKSEIQDYITLPFEDAEFMAFKEYDTILKKTFGNYMELPPKKMRTSQRKFLRFYWKE